MAYKCQSKKKKLKFKEIIMCHQKKGKKERRPMCAIDQDALRF